MSRSWIGLASLVCAMQGFAGMVGTNVNGSVAQEIEALVALKSNVIRTNQFVETAKGLTIYSNDMNGNPVGFQVVGVDFESRQLHVLGQRSTPGIIQRVSSDALRYAQRALSGE